MKGLSSLIDQAETWGRMHFDASFLYLRFDFLLRRPQTY